MPSPTVSRGEFRCDHTSTVVYSIVGPLLAPQLQRLAFFFKKGLKITTMHDRGFRGGDKRSDKMITSVLLNVATLHSNFFWRTEKGLSIRPEK